MLNVPASVLQDVKDLHIRKYAKSKQQASSSAQRPATANSEDLPPRSTSQGSQTSSPQQDDDHETSWSISPVHHLEIPSPGPQQPSSQPKSPLKRKAPPQVVNDEPQSSGVNSSGLEIEPPGYVSQAMEPPVNRTALRVISKASAKPEPTPPSAQLPIATGERVNKPSLAKRRRITEDAHYTGKDSTPKEPAAAMRSSQKPKNGNQTSLNTTATSASSPSLSTQIARGKMSMLSQPKVMSDPAPYRSFTPTFEGRRHESAAQHLVITRTPTPGPSFAPTRAQRSIPTKTPSYTPKPSQRSLRHSLTSSSTSYEMFRLAYPDYSRSSRDFVTALLSVKQLRRDRALHEFLYDDFIRAYSSDYFAYVSECSRKQIDKILPGIQWYNENVQDVLYIKKIVRKNNLAAFLNFHANEAHSIRRALGDSQSTESAVEDSDENMEDGLDGNKEDEPEVIEVSSGAESQASPELHIESPGPVKGSRLRTQPSLRTDEPTGTAHIAQDAGQEDEQMMAGHSSEEDQQPLVEAGTSRRSPEFHTVSPSATKVTAALTKHHAPQARKSTTPTSVRSFASQENGRDFLSPISSSSGGTSRLASSRTHAAMQRQKAPVTSPPQWPLKSVASRGAQTVLVADEDSDDEDAFESPMPSPMVPTAATSLPSNNSRAASTNKTSDDGDDKTVFNVESPIPLPQRAAGPPSSLSRSWDGPVDGQKNEDASAPSRLPAQRNIVSLPNNRPRTISVEEDEATSSEVPMSPLPRVLGPSSSNRSKGLPVDKEDGMDEDDDGPFELQPLRKKNVIAPEPTPRSSTAAAQPITTSTMPALKPSALVQSRVMDRKRSEAGVSKAPSVILGEGRRHSAGSSIASSANVPRSKKRMSETPEQRSLRLKAFMEQQMEKKRRLSSGTPGSPSASRQ